jgi:hypothetical protein
MEYLWSPRPGATAGETDGKVSSGSRGHETILLVDDDAQMSEVARAILTTCGYTVLLADNVAGAHFWAANHLGPIHLLLTGMLVAGRDCPASARNSPGYEGALHVRQSR